MTEQVTAKDVQSWSDEIAVVGERIGRHFVRREPRARAIGYVRELLSDVERKNGWQLAEKLGDSTPDGVQHLLARAYWSPDDVRDELIQYTVENLGGADGVLVVDETGFLKKGVKSVGVSRQYSGTAGRIENCQIGVFLGYVSARGRTLLDRALYLPKTWVEDDARRRAAGVPKEVSSKTKLVLAREMIAHALTLGVPAKWATADAVYGADYHFRLSLENHGLGYVVGVPSSFSAAIGWRHPRAKSLLAEVPPDAWRRISCGDGSKGPRLYDWACLRTASPEPDEYIRGLLFRRSVSDPSDVAYFACGGPPETTLEDWAKVAGKRWAIEECFETAKGDCGLDEYEVRSWTGWYRHVTLSLFALAVIVVIRSKVVKTKQHATSDKPTSRAKRVKGVKKGLPARRGWLR